MPRPSRKSRRQRRSFKQNPLSGLMRDEHMVLLILAVIIIVAFYFYWKRSVPEKGTIEPEPVIEPGPVIETQPEVVITPEPEVEAHRQPVYTNPFLRFVPKTVRWVG